MRRLPISIASLVLLAAAGCAALGRPASVEQAGRTLFETAFNPDRNFAGDLRPSSDDEVLLTAAASNRDDYVPAYSLAIAYRCLPVGSDSENWQCRYVARLLRVRQTDVPWLAELAGARTAAARNAVLDAANFDWLEADVTTCAGGIHAMDSVRIADWRPDIHYALQLVEEREIIMHPAMIRVRMTGSYVTSRYRGWRLGPGVPAAVDRLLEVLEPCWRPAGSARPWNR